MSEIIKISFLGILGILLAIQFKAQRPEYGVIIGLAMGILIFGYVVRRLSGVLEEFQQLHSYLGSMNHYLAVLLRVIGITYVCEFSAGICNDAGYGAVADQIEILGKISVLIASVPILFAVIEQIQNLI